MKKKILILGASGFIGKNLAEYFSQDKKFITYGTYNTRKPKIKNVRLVKIDLQNKKQIGKVLKKKNIVINCAAITSGAKDIISKPYIHVSSNTIINSNVISEAFEKKIDHLIMLSCTLMYSSSKKLIKETDLDLNKQIYDKYFGGAWMKLYMEKMIEFFSKISKNKFTIIRHSNLYGPYDKYDLSKSHVFGASINKAFSSKKKFVILGDGNEKRDLLYIDDFIQFVNLVIKKQKRKFRIYNCGSSNYISVRNLVNKILLLSNKKLKIVYNKKFQSLKTFVKLNCNLAKKELGWTPEVTLEKGIERTIKWYKTEYNIK